MLPCLYVWSLLKQLVLLATATSGDNKLCHVIVFCVEKGFLFFFSLLHIYYLIISYAQGWAGNVIVALVVICRVFFLPQPAVL